MISWRQMKWCFSRCHLLCIKARCEKASRCGNLITTVNESHYYSQSRCPRRRLNYDYMIIGGFVCCVFPSSPSPCWINNVNDARKWKETRWVFPYGVTIVLRINLVLPQRIGSVMHDARRAVLRSKYWVVDRRRSKADSRQADRIVLVRELFGSSTRTVQRCPFNGNLLIE